MSCRMPSCYLMSTLIVLFSDDLSRPAPRVSAEVFCVATVHALTTEAEEVMGLLLGDVHVEFPAALHPCLGALQFPSRSPSLLHHRSAPVLRLQYGDDGEAVARISVAVPQIRADRRKVLLPGLALHIPMPPASAA